MDISAALALRPTAPERSQDVRADDTAYEGPSFSNELDRAVAPQDEAPRESTSASPANAAIAASEKTSVPEPQADLAAGGEVNAISVTLASLMAAQPQSQPTPAASDAQTSAPEQVAAATAIVPAAAAGVTAPQSAASLKTNNGAVPAASQSDAAVPAAQTQTARSAQIDPLTSGEASLAIEQTADANAVIQPESTGNAGPALEALQALQAHSGPLPASALGQPRQTAAKQNGPEKKADAAAPSVAAAPATVQAAAQSNVQKPAAIEELKADGAKSEGSNAGAAAAQAPASTTAVPKDIKPEMAVTAAPPPPAAPTPAPPAPAVLVPHSAPSLVPPDALAATIARKAMEGMNRFEIRLDPAELGRLDVTIEVDDTGHTRAHIRAERPEALELLQRDAKGMEQALRQAGLQTDQASLSFSLAERHKQNGDQHAGHGRKAKFHAVLPPGEIEAAIIHGRSAAASGLDLRV